DDLVSMPVSDPFSNLKILGARLAEDFPLVEDLRQFKSQLYDDNWELVKSYFSNVAVPYYQYKINGKSAVLLRDIWEWNGLLNSALYNTFSIESFKGEAMLQGNQQ
ncbi:hypothetical protein, partial [Salmonella sp. s55044]|uniref:hypothetical protein n=1 Tax=Salmonella sp. s55044 TaxID=3159677 RepID=UPI003980364F